MYKAMVTGGNGFIGSHLTDALTREGHDVTVLDPHPRRYDTLPKQVKHIQGDLRQVYLLKNLLTGVDIVFHLAWASIHESANQNLVADIEANLISSINLLESCVWAGVRRVVFISSGGTVYGQTQQIPIVEEHPKNPINAYGIHKLAVEKYLKMFHHLYGLEYMILRPSVPYGPRQNPLGRQGVVAVFMYRIWQEKELIIWGDGRITRDFFYVSDLVRALMSAAQIPMIAIPVFNIGGEIEISLLDLVERLEHIVGKKAQINFKPGREFDAPRVLLDTERAGRELEWKPEIQLQEGLELTWQWFNRVF